VRTRLQFLTGLLGLGVVARGQSAPSAPPTGEKYLWKDTTGKYFQMDSLGRISEYYPAISIDDLWPNTVQSKKVSDGTYRAVLRGNTVTFETELITVAWQDGKALNNQCPVCGTMAKPFSKAAWVESMNKLGPCMGSTPPLAVCLPAIIDQAPSYNQVRCERCNVIFAQDSE
jgi:hypothetical protein